MVGHGSLPTGLDDTLVLLDTLQKTTAQAKSYNFYKLCCCGSAINRVLRMRIEGIYESKYITSKKKAFIKRFL